MRNREVAERYALVRDKVASILEPNLKREGLEVEDLTDDFDFLEDGILSSLAFIQMIESLESDLDIQLDFEMLDAEEMTKFKSFCTFVAVATCGCTESQRSEESSKNKIPSVRQVVSEGQHSGQKTLAGTESNLDKYASLVIGTFSVWKLVRYELITTFLGPMPGTLGLLLRSWFFPLLFRKAGPGIIFGKSLTIRNPQNITLGEGVLLDDYTYLDGRGAVKGDGISIGSGTMLGRNTYVHAKSGRIDIGDNCQIGSGTIIGAQGSNVKIANQVSIAGACKISGGMFDFRKENGITVLHCYSTGETSIETNVIMGMGSIVLDGVILGAGAKIGAGAVVTNSIPSGVVVAARPPIQIQGLNGAEISG